MKQRIAKIAAAGLLVAGTAAFASTASARDSFNVSIGVPGFAIAYGNRGYYGGYYGSYYGGYYAPPPVAYAPYYYDAPAVYGAPVVYGPRVVYSRPYYRPYYRPYRAHYWYR